MDRLASLYNVPLARGPVSGRVRPPGSKSITNRALVCSAMAAGDSTLLGVLDSDDTSLMLSCLRSLGVSVAGELADGTLKVRGSRGTVPSKEAALFVGNSGTTIRFLSALLATAAGRYELDGVPRMRERPIEPLVAALREHGIDAACADNGCPPLTIQGAGLPGGDMSVAGTLSSQFLTGLLLAAPMALDPLTIRVDGALVSRPYIDMTLRVMQQFGVQVDEQETQAFAVPSNVGYQGCSFDVEPDASAASYFFALPALLGGEITVEGLGDGSCQGDLAFVHALEQMGCEIQRGPDSTTIVGKATQGIEIDMNGISDTVQTLAAVAMFAEGPTRITGVEHIRHKETDRIEDLARELRKLGPRVETFTDGLTITPDTHRSATIETYDDHRMAMSLSLTGLVIDGVVIKDPGCTSKTYPGFFRDLESVLAQS
jgi:3-phosphoshikimate 1-carboxyvinyltransferase